ncbi:unnamed protein product [Wuchereria bancrofti]|nr:unnamed protein product [Wuchereria bancrofti]
MFDEDSASEQDENKPRTLFEERKRLMQERINSVKQSMLNLRIRLRETTTSKNVKEVHCIFDRITYLQNIADQDAENLIIELEESRRIRQKKILENRILLERSKCILDESLSLLAKFEEFVINGRKRQQPPSSSSTLTNDNKN